MLSLSSDLPPLDEVAAPSLAAPQPSPPPVDRMSKRGSSETLVYEESKAHLLKPTSNNPMPTAVPPPIAATAGTLGVRHVLIIIGLPERGKPFIARRLERYLSFFHGAEVRLFDISKYARLEGAGAAGSEANAEHLLADMKKFFSPQNSTAARNMNAARRSVDPAATAADFDQQLIDENDRRRKNVDSGRVGIIFSTDSFGSFKERWSGTSKERRRWAAETIAKEHETLGAKLIFIEVLVDNPSIIEANIRAKRRAQVRAAQFGAICRAIRRNSVGRRRLSSRAQGDGPTTPAVVREYEKRMTHYKRMYVTLQVRHATPHLSPATPTFPTFSHTASGCASRCRTTARRTTSAT